MVSFTNIMLNQPVEVRKRGSICKGVVKYKGSLNGIPGDWVGVALSMPGKLNQRHTLFFELLVKF